MYKLQTGFHTLSEISEHIPSSYSDQIVHLNPATIAQCGFHYGKPIVINKTRVHILWPDKSIPLTGVGVPTAKLPCFWDEPSIESERWVIIERVPGPIRQAAVIYCDTR